MIRKIYTSFLLILFCVIYFSTEIYAQKLNIGNELISINVNIKDGVLQSDSVFFKKDTQNLLMLSDADFKADFFWTDWRYPGKDNNGDNSISLTKKDFTFQSSEIKKIESKTELIVFLKAIQLPIEVKLTYSIEEGKTYFRRHLTMRDMKHGIHFLEMIHPSCQNILLSENVDFSSSDMSIKVEGSEEYMNLGSSKSSKDRLMILKAGSFGQPVAVQLLETGFFAGLEFPASINSIIHNANSSLSLDCSQNIGEEVKKEWVQTESVVYGFVASQNVKNSFMDYVKDICVAEVKPYTLYNSWYDLRSVVYPRVPEENIMNEKNVLRMVDLVRKNMIEKHNISLDAFVLDDGWDIYESDWKLRSEQFPHGMKPIADKLKETNTDLGIWFGPTGGYSFKMQRLKWMSKHGYEMIHDYDTTYGHSMMCLAGEKYSKLFEKRVVNFVKNDGVSFFKWDGIQFSCSNPNHGHPVGRYSRRATINALHGICDAVRAENKDTYLNITSGTWLSPWWLKYSNQIWMDGMDYAFANVPSITKRDNAITYRDFVLYDDFHQKDLWFPIANLMTHGIIKGKLDHIGGLQEPIDKFTDNALLYFARGVSMWELYISPDILTDQEWTAISKSIKWAKQRFDILDKTFLVGGNPMKNETYAYLHFQDDRGVIAARNPSVQPQILYIPLDSKYGIDPMASNLVIEKTYPLGFVSPQLYSAGGMIKIELQGYETAIFDIYPIEKTEMPLVAGVKYNRTINSGEVEYQLFGCNAEAKIMNPDKAKSIIFNDEEIKSTKIDLSGNKINEEPVFNLKGSSKRDVFIIKGTISLPGNYSKSQLAVLLIPDEKQKETQCEFVINKKDVNCDVQAQKGKWEWYTCDVNKENNIEIEISGDDYWKGKAEVWLVTYQNNKTSMLKIRTDKDAEFLTQTPKPWNAGVERKQIKLISFTR